jgi:ubiquinone/menaquinone biosynthesis C-methylase UbiE
MEYLLLGPIRRLLQNPKTILKPFVEPGMTVLDIGPGMGFFTLELARYVGPGGKVVAIDLQERMIKALDRRARRAGLADRIDSRVCGSERLGADDLAGSIDLTLAFNLVHEVPDACSLCREVHTLLADRGRFYIVEPAGHVSEGEFDETLAVAREAGFILLERPEVRRSRAALLEKR